MVGMPLNEKKCINEMWPSMFTLPVILTFDFTGQIQVQYDMCYISVKKWPISTKQQSYSTER